MHKQRERKSQPDNGKVFLLFIRMFSCPLVSASAVLQYEDSTSSLCRSYGSAFVELANRSVQRPVILFTFLLAQVAPALPDARAEAISSVPRVVYSDTKLMV